MTAAERTLAHLGALFAGAMVGLLIIGACAECSAQREEEWPLFVEVSHG